MEDAEEIVIAAKNILPDNKFDNFVGEFRELLKEPLAQDWRVKSLSIFKVTEGCDDLTRKLFTFLLSRVEYDSYEIVFLESAYLHLDCSTYADFFLAMLQFVGYKLKTTIMEIPFEGYRLLEIVRARESQHRMECEESGVDFPFAFYKNFLFMFEMYLSLDHYTFLELIHVIYDHVNRGAPNDVEEVERLKRKAFEIRLSNYRRIQLLYFCTGGIMTTSSTTCDIFPYLLDKQNRPISERGTPTDPPPDSTSTVFGKDIRIQEHSAPVSSFPVEHNHPVLISLITQSEPNNPIPVHNGNDRIFLDLSSPGNLEPDPETAVGQGTRIPKHPAPAIQVIHNLNLPVQSASTLHNPSSVPVGKDLPGPSTPVNPKPDSATTADGQNYSVQGIWTPEQPNPFSAIPVLHNNPIKGASTFYNPSTVPVGKDLSDSSTPDKKKPDSAITVGHAHSVQDIWIPELQDQFPVILAGHNDPVQGDLTRDNLYGKNYPATPGHQFPIIYTPVEPSYSVPDPHTSLHSNTNGSNFALPHYKPWVIVTSSAIMGTWTKQQPTEDHELPSYFQAIAELNRQAKNSDSEEKGREINRITRIPTPDSTSTAIRKGILEHAFPVGHNRSDQITSTLNNPSTVPVGKDLLPDHSTPDNPKPDSAITAGHGQNYSVRDIWTPDQPNSFLAVPDWHNCPIKGVLTLDTISTVPVGKNLPDLSTPDNRKPDSATMVGHGQPNSFLAFPVSRYCPIKGASTLGTPSTVPVRKDLPDPSTPDNPKPDSATTLGHGHSIQDSSIPGHPNQSSAVLFRALNDPVEGALTLNNPPAEFGTPGYQFSNTYSPVQPSYSVQDPRTSVHSNTNGSNLVLPHYKPWVTATSSNIMGTWTKQRSTEDHELPSYFQAMAERNRLTKNSDSEEK